MKSKRCLFIMPILFCGGSEKQIRLIVDGLSQRGYPLSVLVEGTSPESYVMEDSFVRTHSNVSFVFLRIPFVSAKHENLFIRYYSKLKSLILMSFAIRREIKCRDVGIVMITNLTGLIQVPLFKWFGCKVIFNERNPGVNVTKSFWKRILLSKCDLIVCNSKSASVIMQEKLNRFVDVMNNGVIAKEFLPKKKSQDVMEILIPARISKVKNQLNILKAISVLKSKYNFFCKVTFAGVVEDCLYKKEMDSFIVQNHIESYVKFLGFVSDMDELYRKTDLVILASYEEGTPNVLLESFMCGTNVLASNIPMNNDCMQDKSFLFDPNDFEALANKIKWIESLDDAYLSNNLTINRRFVEKNYGVDKMIDRYVAKLKSV